MATKELGFKGIERINKGIFCNEGSCEELINLRHDGNTWRSVGSKLVMDDIKGIAKQRSINQSFPEKAVILGVYIHNCSKDLFCIVHQTFSNVESISLYSINSDGIGQIPVSGNSLYNLSDNEEFLSLSSLNNVLIVCTTQKKLYFLYKDDVYIQINMDLNNNGILTAGAYQDLNTDGSLKIHSYDSYNWGDLYDASEMIRTTYNKLLESAKTYGLYSGLSLFRYVIKMYDGTYLYYSNIDFADTNGDNGGTRGSVINNLNFSLLAKYENATVRSYKVGLCINNTGSHIVNITFSDLATIKQLFDLNIIVSIDVYMTRPILQFNIDCKLEDLNDCSDIGISTQLVIGGEDIRALHYRCPINKKAIIDQVTNGIFYKVKSFKSDDINKAINNYSNVLTADIFYKDIEVLTSAETLVTDNGRDEILFSKSYTYNRKQHVYDLLYNVFNGYTFPRSVGYNPTSLGDFNLLCGRLGITDGIMYALIKGRYNNENFVVRVPINNPDDYISYQFDSTGVSYNIHFYLPRLLTYPTLEGFELNIYVSNGTTSKSIYAKETNQISYINNFGFTASLYTDNNINEYFQNKIYVVFQHIISGLNGGVTIVSNANPYIESSLKQEIVIKNISDVNTCNFILKNQIPFKNTLQLSETDNPFIYPAKNSYSFGENTTKILSVQATVGQMTETKFGLYPLYVFTDIGIFAMGVGSGDIAYANITPINNQVIINKQTLNIGSSIMYLADNGLNIISGRDSQLISELVKGNPDSSSIISSIMSDLSTNFGFTDNDFSTQNFLEEIQTAKFAYDNVHNEVLFVCPNYTYVFNLKNNYFHKITDVFNDVYINGNETILSRENLNLLNFYSPSNESTNINNRSIIITKPFNLGTRQYKKVIKFILSMTINTVSGINAKPNVELWLFGTNDMINYIPYKNISITSPKYLQDIFLSRFFKSFNYAIFVIATKQNDCCISGGQFEFDITMGRGGIR